jgi:catechol 2,3-dioxygenase-like lactoylglutathione lyase family enzyme
MDGIQGDEIQAVVETGIYADDLAAAEAFYRDVLGLVLLDREAGRHVFFRVGPASLLLVFNAQASSKGEVLPAHGASGPGHFAFGMRAGSLGHWRQRLTEHGVAIEKEVAWPRGGRSLYFRDPAGNLVEIVTPGIWGTPAGW